MKPLHDDLAFFARLINALRPRLGEVVIAGGWAHRLHRLHSLARALEYPPLLTRDADVVLDPAAAPHSDDIRASLDAAGFTKELLGEDRQPPITQYRLPDQSSTSYAEFLVPLHHAYHKRWRLRSFEAVPQGLATSCTVAAARKQSSSDPPSQERVVGPQASCRVW